MVWCMSKAHCTWCQSPVWTPSGCGWSRLKIAIIHVINLWELARCFLTCVLQEWPYQFVKDPFQDLLCYHLLRGKCSCLSICALTKSSYVRRSKCSSTITRLTALGSYVWCIRYSWYQWPSLLNSPCNNTSIGMTSYIHQGGQPTEMCLCSVCVIYGKLYVN